MKKVFKGVLFVLGLFTVSLASADMGAPLKSLPVQDSGRLKPYDTFATESLKLIYGKSTYKKRSAVEIITTWMLIPDHWDQEPIIEIRHSGLREALKLPEGRVHFSPVEMMTHERLPLLFQELAGQRKIGEKLNPYFQEVQRLENQLTLYQAIKLGMALRVAPSAEGDTWVAVKDLDGELSEQFAEMKRIWLVGVTAENEGRKEEAQKALGDLKQAVAKFTDSARAVAPEKYASGQLIGLEVHYNAFHPFRWSWVAYLLGSLLMVLFLFSERAWLNGASWGAMWLGLGLHTYGMIVRSILSGRPPVSNMYETVVWVPWGVVIFAMILAKFQKHKALIPASGIVATLCLVLTDLAPSVLDGSLQPLEPVLRSTFWLTTHVLIITISYAAFFLAFALGDLLLFYALRDEAKYAAAIQKGAQSIYRSIQIGVVLLAAGIILGGIWADYSWGRFWGWDPKETWALIALLGYLALLHGRLVGWVKNFELAAGSVIAFSLVIMAWYGVNFVLGAGLHSYGFGAGGVEWVSLFVAAHILYVAFVWTVRRSRLKSK